MSRGRRGRACFDLEYSMHQERGGRREQEDACRVLVDPDEGTLLAVVSDGVGGSDAGGLASSRVVETACRLWVRYEGVFPEPKAQLMELAREAHDSIRQDAARGRGSGKATLVAVYLGNGEAHWVHSGDSRIHHFKGRELTFRSRDHSVLQLLVDSRRVAAGETTGHPDQSRLTRCLGDTSFREPDYGTSVVAGGDGFCLCSDGFWSGGSVDAMAEILEGRSMDVRLIEAVRRAADANGPEGDNVTAVSLRVRRRSVPVARWTLIAPFVLLLAACGVLAVSWMEPWRSGARRASDAANGGTSAAEHSVPPKVGAAKGPGLKGGGEAREHEPLPVDGDGLKDEKHPLDDGSLRNREEPE